jgi:hypothetical protein
MTDLTPAAEFDDELAMLAEAEYGYTESDRFRIDDDSAAAWAMRKLRAARRRIEANDALAAEEFDRVETWRNAVNASHERTIEYFVGLLSQYALACRENPDDGRKTLALPAGKVTTRPGGWKWHASDEFLTWAGAHAPDLVRVKTEPALNEIKKRFIARDDGSAVDGATAEIVPGLSVTKSEPTATVSPDLT